MNKIAIITGASRGIGREVALGLSKQGYKLGLIARNKAQLEELAQLCDQKNGRCLFFAHDITDEQALNSSVSEVIDKWGRVDVLFNNAGIFKSGSITENSTDFDEVFKVNVKGAYLTLQAVVPQMLKQKSGHILNLASIAGKFGYSGVGIYCSSKFALVGLSESLFNELVPQGIKVTAICPHYVNTQMAKNAGSSYSEAEMIQTSDIMQTVNWLLSLSPSACVSEVVIRCSAAV